MNIQIRGAVANDIVGIAVLTNQLGYVTDEKTTAEIFTVVQQQKNTVVYVAVDENKIRGWLHMSEIVSLESGSFYEILGMVVDEAYQNLGIGKRLVQEAIRWSRNQGALSLRVRSNVKRRQAHAFYMRQGFMEIKEQKVFNLNLNP